MDVKKTFMGIRTARARAERQDHGGHYGKKGRAWNIKSTEGEKILHSAHSDHELNLAT